MYLAHANFLIHYLYGRAALNWNSRDLNFVARFVVQQSFALHLTSKCFYFPSKTSTLDFRQCLVRMNMLFSKGTDISRIGALTKLTVALKDKMSYN